MKTLKYILGILAILIIGVIVAAMVTQKTDYDINQSMVINASPAQVSDYVSDLKTWSTWGPWNKADTTIVTTYGDVSKGEGANMSWTSKDGPGELTIASYEPGNSITTKMDFGGSPADGYWKFEGEGEGTNVTWGMKGKKNLMFKVISMFMGFDEFMANMQMKGLNGIQQNIGSYNGAAASAYKLSEVEMMDGKEKYLIGYPHHGGMEGIDANFQTDMPKAGMFAGKAGITDFTPGAVWSKWDEGNNEADYVIGLLVNSADKMADGMEKTTIPAGKVLKISKWGPYGSGDREAHDAIYKHMEENDLEHVLTWEEYVNDPTEVKPEEVQVDIYYAVK